MWYEIPKAAETGPSARPGRAGDRTAGGGVGGFAGAVPGGGRMFELSGGSRRRAPPSPGGESGGAPGGGESDGREPGRRRSSLDLGFDRYLARQLHELYDPVLDEAVPDEIARLLARFGPRDGGGGGGEEPDRGG